MSDIFIAHVEEDTDVALEIALGLEEAGYTTWSYEVDSIPGPSYLIQTGEAVAASKAVVVVISSDSLGSRQVTKEVVRAHETGKEFVPVLRDITHIEFQNRQPEWREAIGGAASVSVSLEGIAEIIPRIASGLNAMGITPGSTIEKGRIAQIRKILDGLNKSGVSESTGQIPAVTEIGRDETKEVEKITGFVEEIEKPAQATKKLTKSPWFWAGVALLFFASIFLLGMASSYVEQTTVSERLGLSVRVVTVGLPFMLLGAYFLKRGFSQSLKSKKAWLRSAYILLPVGLLLFILVTSGLNDLPSEPARHLLFFVLTVALVPFFFVGGYCLRRGIKM